MSMMERLLAFVGQAEFSRSDETVRKAAGDDGLAVAALLVHVARVDGVFEPAEQRRMSELLQGRFSLSEAGARDLIAQGQRIDREIGDLSDLVELVGHGPARAECERIVAMAFAIAAADGSIGEFEDDLVWRLGRLLGLDESDIERLRAREAPPPADARAP